MQIKYLDYTKLVKIFKGRFSRGMGVKLAKPKSFDDMGDWKVVHAKLL